MNRPRADEWAVIGEQADPVPGDPEEVAKLGRELRKTARSIRKQADEIRALSSVDQWKSKAAKEFRNEAVEAEGKLRKAMRRYDAAADALGEKVSDGGCSTEYASELHRAQTMADKALREARDAVDEQKASEGALDRLPHDTPEDDPRRRKLEKRQEEAATALERARNRLEAATAVRDAAAKRARESIRYAIDHDGLKDGTWDTVKGWVHDNAGWIKTALDVAGWVATVCGTLALMVGWIPVLGPVLAGALGTVALAATLFSLVGHTLLAMAGEGSWFDVALDVVGIATLGIGRGALAAAKGATTAAQSLGRSAAARALRQGIKAKPGTAAYNKAVNKAWRKANELSGSAVRGQSAAQAVASAPKGWFPGAQRLADAFDPRLIYRESADSLKAVKDLRLSDLRRLGHADTWRGVRPGMSDPGIADLEKGLGRMSHTLRADDGVRAATDVFRTQTRIWAGSTAVASATDLLDKGEVTGPVGDLAGVPGLDDGVWEATGIKTATTTSNG
ncbi:putative T7SS-secreted protein [Streptomyces pseudogriseolus]|uniref:putative T7SS-secreted protein n=1 Tax=Streptomyces pseudogriseolus TaxID=36817 RepID=UPI00347C49FE